MIDYLTGDIYKSDNINDIYRTLVIDVLTFGDVIHEVNKDNDTSEFCGTHVILTNMNNNIVWPRTNITYALGELIWYFSGNNSLSFIRKFSRRWDLLSDDNQRCNSAYGYIIQEKFGFNQITTIIDLLTANPNSRRAVININWPRDDVQYTKDDCCTLCIQFLIRNNKLNTFVYMRSNDLYTGFPYDVLYFTELTKYIANKLNIETGEYHHFCGSIHTYRKNMKKITENVNSISRCPYKININSLVNRLFFLVPYCVNMDAEGMNRKEFQETLITICKTFHILEEQK